LARKEPLKRPGLPDRYPDDEFWDDDDDDEQDWDDIDDQWWNVVEKCCAPEPEDRLTIPAIKKLLVDMKIWDDRPPAKPLEVDPEVLKLTSNREVDLRRAGDLTEEVQVC
jgi:hypothetical protein